MLEVRGLSAAYGPVRALDGIDLTVAAGELVALVGANGAGKTTLLRVLSGLLPAAAGTIVFDGEAITKTPSDLRVRLGITQVPEGRQVFTALSVLDNLRLGGYARPRKDTREDMDRVLSIFPVLRERADSPAGDLSGGQQQMLAIGRALMARPRLLLLDEPSMGLAPQVVDEIFDVILRLRREGATVLLVEQNAQMALSVADRGYVIESGHLVLEGPGPALLENDQVQRVYLGFDG